MTHPLNTAPCEFLDIQEWDECEVRDLVRTTPLRFDQDGHPDGYEAEQLFGLEGSFLGGQFR
jgi:hypothetical protein